MLLDKIDVAGKIVTADAMSMQRGLLRKSERGFQVEKRLYVSSMPGSSVSGCS